MGRTGKVVGGVILGSMVGGGLGAVTGFQVIGSVVGAILLPGVLLELDKKEK